MLSVGDKAPNFNLMSQWDKKVALDDFYGQWLVVWWIPSTMAEMTPACCDTIAKGFTAKLFNHPALNVVGLSFDTPEQMREFASRANAPFPLLADTDKTVGTEYGVLRTGDWDCFPKKMAFLVNPDGYVAKIYNNIDPDFFVDEIIYDLNELDVIVDESPSLYRRLIGS